jgi:phage anti-repressor protein
MELQIHISQKGTKVVTASELHRALGLPIRQYDTDLRHWLSDIYEFKDGIRKPQHLKDHAPRNAKQRETPDHYLSLELAKLITLNSKSKFKQKYALFLQQNQDGADQAGLFSLEQIKAAMELARAMGLVSCQLASEKLHHDAYEARHHGQPANWWRYRAELLGYSCAQLKEALHKLGKPTNGKNCRQLLMQTDKYEMVRTGVIDLLMAMGKSGQAARNFGDLTKLLATALEVEVFDDRGMPFSPAENMNQELVDEIKNLKRGKCQNWWHQQRLAS